MALATGARARPARPARTTSAQARRQRAGLLFVLPSVTFVGLFFIVPLLITAFMSLHNWPLLGDRHFIGLGNYHALISDTMFWNSLIFTVKYTVVITPIIVVVAFGLALLVRQHIPGVAIFRTAYFLPVVIGLSTASIMWIYMFNDQSGVFDGILQGLGLIKAPIEWLGDPNGALLSVIFMVVWKAVGSTMLFFVIGLQAIPDDLYEAARMDGAGRWALTRYITLPLLRRIFALALVLSVIGSFLAFDQFYIITQGGPQNSTISIVYWIYNTSFTYFKLGYGAALSLVLLVILVAVSVVQLYLLRDDAHS
ncbi:MAG: sugar ABC transporter permease [Chloroflexota bacterium]|nr:sugar ABC transporter permease [Chloroflexota bacterium]